MPLKGVLLGALGIVHPAVRPLRDADVLIEGCGLTRATRALSKHGFRLTDVPWSHGYLSFAHPEHPTLWLDLHTVVMPFGLGRLAPRYLFERSYTDSALFGAPVQVPLPHALMVQLLANVVKDRIVMAFDHVPNDLALAARRLSGDELVSSARDLRSLALARGGALALAWAHGRTGEPRLQELLEALVVSAAERREVVALVAQMDRDDQGTIWSRLRARAGADRRWLQGIAAAFTAASVATHPVRKAWLLANNRGDVSQDMR